MLKEDLKNTLKSSKLAKLLAKQLAKILSIELNINCYKNIKTEVLSHINVSYSVLLFGNMQCNITASSCCMLVQCCRINTQLNRADYCVQDICITPGLYSKNELASPLPLPHWWLSYSPVLSGMPLKGSCNSILLRLKTALTFDLFNNYPPACSVTKKRYCFISKGGL